MPASGEDRLVSLLSSNERELVNIKFFLGSEVQSSDQLMGAVCDALTQGLDKLGARDVPATARKPAATGDLVAQF